MSWVKTVTASIGMFFGSMAAAADFDTTAAWALIDEGATLIDVRTESEYAAGHLEGAILIPHDQFSTHIEKLVAADKPIVVYCRSGRRSGLVTTQLKNAGFDKVVNGGGYEMLKASRP